MIPTSQVRFTGRRLQKRAPELVSSCWFLEEGSPRMLVRSKKTPSMTEMGRVAAVLMSLAPEGMPWTVIRYGALTRSHAVPTITHETTWHGSEDGLKPHDIEAMPASRLQDIEDRMSLIPTPSTDE